MNSVVTTRFVTCLKKLKEENRVRSYRQFALSLDYLPQSLNDIIHGNRDVTIELCRKASEKYKFNLDFLFKGVGTPFQDSVQNDDKIVTVVTDNYGNECITYVDVQAFAGYGDNLHDPVFMKNLPSFSLPDPMLQHGTFRCFGVYGDSMEPSLHGGDRIICSFIEQQDWEHAIQDKQTYVIVTQNEVLVKRLDNRIKESREIILNSDNKSYPSYELPVDEVREIWAVKYKLSKFLSKPLQDKLKVSEELTALRKDIEQQSGLIKNLNLTLENLLKQQRSQRVR